MKPGPIALPGCAYSVWVAQRTLAVTVVTDCAPRYSTNVNNKPIAIANTCTQTDFVLERPLPQHRFSCFLPFPSSHHTRMEKINKSPAFIYQIKVK